ncbi:MAG: cupredoxin domain-containing protein [bacterium]
MKKTFLILGAAIILLLLFIVVYSVNNNAGVNLSNVKKETGQTGQPAVPGQKTTAVNPALEKKPDYKVSVSISSDGFMPNILTVREGDVVELAIISVDSSKHSFDFFPKIEGVSQVEVGAGKTAVIKFVAPAAGSYNYNDRQSGHEKEIGKMTVISRSAVISGTAQKESAPTKQAYKLMLSVSSDGFYPKEFTVNSGQAVELTILPVDNGRHAFKFIQAVAGLGAIVLEPNKKNIINFQAPAKGAYGFICPEAGHEKETGKMIVN